MGKTRVQKYSQSRTSNPFEFTKLLNHNVGRYIFNVMDQEEFRGFSAHPLQRITTLREVLDNPSFLNLSSNDPSNGPKGNADEEEDWLTRDYEIKEQDRWLPLANGELNTIYKSSGKN
ncbi:hypothetical protein WICMUC_002730 [Wickerhamomyces mucosus]|uniref:Uncharacterized protein n=1 Tax=Wickerhamomyces mucosus TaxID=1378264 RepID=A0A9P8TEI8_9ASCO|nr:hypothetical protein WICMUC_002730 [Wickerhamomyces mucosus]